MKKIYAFLFVLVALSISAYSQCPNAGFESANFTSWAGTYAASSSTPTIGFNIGAVNAPPSDNLPQHIMTSGFDVLLGGTVLPQVSPLGGNSMRLGNAVGNAYGETVSYSMTVNASNSSFTYYYAVVLDGSSTHTAALQPYFKITMTSAGTGIPCATYDVNSTSSVSIGFDSATVGGTVVLGTVIGAQKVYYKKWSAVTIPLQNYIGQTVTVTFETRDCQGSGAGGTGTHWAYAYVDAACAPSEITPSSASVCPGEQVKLTAPVGAKTYSWVGPTGSSIVSGANTATVTVNMPGTYTVNMVPFGTNPCPYFLTAVMSPRIGTAKPNFTYSPTCVGAAMSFTDISTSPVPIIGWAWDFNNDGVTDATTQNPSYTFPAVTTYPVKLTTYNPCANDTTINVTVSPLPIASFTANSVCSGVGATITYTGNAPANATYNWNFAGGTVLSGTGQGPYSVSWPTSGTKNVTLSVGIGASCTSTLTTVPVTILPTPVITVNSASYCVGGSATLTANGGTTYSWSPAADLSATSGNGITANPTTTTTYTVYGTTTGCTGSATSTVTVVPYEDASFTYSRATYCAPSSDTPIKNSAVGGTYSINPATNLVINTSTGFIDVVNTTNIVPYVVTRSTNGVCPSTYTVGITVVANPVATFSYSGPYCKNGTPNATITQPVGATPGVFTALPAGLTFVSATSGEINLTASAPGTYTVTNTIAAGGGCPAATATNTVLINGLPPTAASSTTICTGATGTITASGATGYVWQDNSTSASFSASPTSTTTYTVTGSTFGCPSPAVGTIVVNPIPVTMVSNSTVCAAETTTLTASGATTYVWQNNSTSPNFVTSTLQNTTYTVTGTSLGCSSSAAGTIFIKPSPTTNVADATICSGTFANLTANGADSYVWSTTETTSAISVNPTISTSYSVKGTTAGCSLTANAMAFVITPTVTVKSTTICIGQQGSLFASDAGTYSWAPGGVTGSILTDNPTSTTSYTVTGTTSGCPATAVGTIYVNPTPGVSVNNATICMGQTATLTATNASFYSWAPNVGNTGTVYVSPAISSSYTVTGTSIGCTSAVVANVLVNPLPTGLVTGDVNVCKNDPPVRILFTGSAGTAPYTFVYKVNGSGNQTVTTITGDTVTISSALPTVVGPINYALVSVQDANTCVQAQSDNAVITVNSLPTATIVDDTTVCKNEKAIITLIGANSTAPYTFNYLFNGTPRTINSTGNTATVSVPTSAAGTYTYALVSVQGATTCSSVVTGSVVAVVNPLPTAKVISDQEVCRNTPQPLITFIGKGKAPFVFTFNVNGNPTTYQSTGANDSAFLPVMTDKVGAYAYSLVKVTDGNGCEQAQTGKATIVVYENPLASFTVNPERTSALEPTIDIKDASISTTLWMWDFGDGNMSAAKNPESHTYADTGTFKIKLIAYNGICQDSTYHTVKVFLPLMIYIPNTFSPNGDGINDVFKAEGDGILKFEMMIFDRWGQLLFMSTDINKGWDGKVSGGSEPAQVDSYVYVVNIKALTNKHDYTYRGVVNLIK